MWNMTENGFIKDETSLQILLYISLAGFVCYTVFLKAVMV
jgi:hypothetical protein